MTIKAAYGYFEESELKDFKFEELKSLSDVLMINPEDGEGRWSWIHS